MSSFGNTTQHIMVNSQAVPNTFPLTSSATLQVAFSSELLLLLGHTHMYCSLVTPTCIAPWSHPHVFSNGTLSSAGLCCCPSVSTAPHLNSLLSFAAMFCSTPDIYGLNSGRSVLCGISCRKTLDECLCYRPSSTVSAAKPFPSPKVAHQAAA